MFLLGLLTGILLSLTGFLILYFQGKKERDLYLQYQREKDDLLLKSLPLYVQAQRVFKEGEISPQKFASMLLLADFLEQELERQALEANPEKVQ